MLRSELYGLPNELVLCLFNIKFTFLCLQFLFSIKRSLPQYQLTSYFSNIYISIFMLLILHQKMLTTTSANKILFRSFGESTDRRSGRRGGLMVNTLDSGSKYPGSSPCRVYCVVFLGKTLAS